MEILAYIILFVFSALFVGTSLWLSAKFVKVECTFPGMLLIAAATSLLSLIPGVGWIIALVALYFMLHKWTTAEFWPDSVILVVAAGAIRFFVGLALAAVFSALG
jgi:hypothetical protein